MKILSTTFTGSSPDLRSCPAPDRPEFAFIGRSNVGKSSLINMLVERSKMAKTSSTPGKTQLINHFNVNEMFFIADLPGYGWAKVSKKQRLAWQKMTDDYLSKRSNLLCTFVLIDSRHEPQRIDLDFIEKLGVNEIPFVLLFTKSDKQSSAKTEKNITKFKAVMSETWETLPPYFISSSVNRTGREEILDFIEKTLQAVLKT